MNFGSSAGKLNKYNVNYICSLNFIIEAPCFSIK